MSLSLKKVSGLLCTAFTGAIVAPVHANVDREICEDVCEPEKCDTRVTEFWYAFDADGNEALADGIDVNRCKKQIGIKSGGTCKTECRIESVQPWGEPHAILPEDRDEFLDGFSFDNLMTDVFAEDLASQCDTALVECDNEPPNCKSVVDMDVSPPMISVGECTDDVSGCNEATFTVAELDIENLPAIVDACDNAGNCRSCDAAPIDTSPPNCEATFDNADQWHRGESFEVDPPLNCWLVSCEDPIGENDDFASGCLIYNTGNEENSDSTNPVMVKSLEPIDGAACTLEVCDNFGNCSTCDSPQLKYEDTDICTGENIVKTADGTCGECEAGDNDCLCILGDSTKCREDGPINCYTSPFHDRCPGFENAACLSDPFTPGCPVVNPCYPTKLYDVSICPLDAIRFCARNPYHYGCNVACASGHIACSPDAPIDGALPPAAGLPAVDADEGVGNTCLATPECLEGSTFVDDGAGADGCAVGHCENAAGEAVDLTDVIIDDEPEVEVGYADFCSGDVAPDCAEGEKISCSLDEATDCQSCECVAEVTACAIENPNCGDFDTLCTASGVDGNVDECGECRCVGEVPDTAPDAQFLSAPDCADTPVPACAAGSVFHCELDPDTDCQTCTCLDGPAACTADALVCDDGKAMLCADPGCQGNGSCRCIDE